MATPLWLWLTLTPPERDLLEEALSAFDARSAVGVTELLERLRHAQPQPEITVGVRGGLVQWVRGNPFPVRVCDYDGDGRDLPDVDEEGNRCSIWLEIADPRISPT